jgi:hypothetical protein
MTLQLPSAAILIDCWDLKTDGSRILYDNIINFLDSNDQIKTVILASYNCWSERNNHTVWWGNNIEFFSMDSSRVIRDIWKMQRGYYEFCPDAKPVAEKHTDPAILNYVNRSKYQIAMTETWELIHYLSKNQDIKNLYMCGLSWDQCVKYRPLGYDMLSKTSDLNILANRLCLHDQWRYPNIDRDSNWDKIADDTYKLKTTVKKTKKKKLSVLKS